MITIRFRVDSSLKDLINRTVNAENLTKSLAEGTEGIVNKYVSHVRKTILGGGNSGSVHINWKELSPVTKRIKGHDRIWIDSGDSFSGISYLSTMYGKGYTYVMGFIKSKTSAPAFMTYGTRNMPKRPLLLPVFTYGRYMRKLKDMFNSVFRSYFLEDVNLIIAKFKGDVYF